MEKYEPPFQIRPEDFSSFVEKDLHENESAEILDAQEGEQTNHSLTKELGVGKKTVKDIADKFRQEHPEWFTNRKHQRGHIREHYSPELIKKIKEAIGTIKPVKKTGRSFTIGAENPAGKTLKTLAEDLHKNPDTVREIADSYRKKHPEWFTFAKTPRGHVREHFHPELIRMIKRRIDFKVLLEPQPGERTCASLQVEWGQPWLKINGIANTYRESHPDWFNMRRGPRGISHEFYSSDLIKCIKNDIEQEKNIPEPQPGEMAKSQLSEATGFTSRRISQIAEQHREAHPEWFVIRKNSQGGRHEYYAAGLVALIREELSIWEDIPEPAAGEIPNSILAEEIQLTAALVKKLSNLYRSSNPEWFVKRRNPAGMVSEYYVPALVEHLKDDARRWTDTPLQKDGEFSNSALAHDIGASQSKIRMIAEKFRKSNPEWFIMRRNLNGAVFDAYAPNLVEHIRKECAEMPVPKPGELTRTEMAAELGLNRSTITALAEKYRPDHPEYFVFRKIKNGLIFEHFSKELVDQLRKDAAEWFATPSPREGEMTKTGLADALGVSSDRIERLAEIYRVQHPSFFSNRRNAKGGVYEYYAPELVKIISNVIGPIRHSENAKESIKSLQSNFEDLLQEITEADSEHAKKIGNIIRLLPGNAHDIILKYHPEYHSLKVGYVNKIIADYLGDFMLAQKDWRSEDIESFKEVAGIENIHEAILFNLKNSCLTFANALRRNEADLSEEQLIERYFKEEVMTKLLESGIPELEQAVRELREYFNEVLALRYHKPDNIVASMKPGRLFPDINQLVNIKEIRDNKRMLIADEMGLGKSASAILSKEFLGLRCALIIVPSNVCDSWASYLSDRQGPDGKQIGYFEKGLAPKVLMISSFEDAQRLQNEVFDYVIVSQERMAGSRYVNILSEVDFDMMIVDEVHKLKNIESGSRSMSLLALAENIKGDDKYLALLSGTPAPNTVLDFAITLKLLYPERYKDFTNQEMTTRILYGDLINLRTELLMRMQMKDIASSIELPPLTEEDIEIDLSLEEREIYEILLEEDELTASQKIILFRQFLLNPELLKIEADFAGSKVKALRETLAEDFKTKNKVVVFVNGYIEGVIRGDNNIIRKLGLPADVRIETIHGGTNREERRRIEKEFNTSDGKIAVFVSGQTADVGIDLSGGDETIFYNEPWSMYEKRQQRARVYREGLKLPLASKTLVARNTIEEGIRRYILAKEKAIQKLLRGIGNTEAEKRLLSNDAKHHKENVETNVELSKQYLSDWEKLLVHFGQGFQAGAKRFEQELGRMGKEYADLYQKLGRLTYQGNNARVSATMIATMIEEKGQPLEDLRILDIASGPEMLKEAAAGKLRDRIFSLDINAEHFVSSPEKRKTITGSYLDLPARNGSIDYCNLGFAYHQTSKIKYHKKNYERLQVLAEMNRVLKPGGRAVISMLHNVKLPNHEAWQKLVDKLGFRIVDEYSGEASGERHYRADFFTLEKIRDIEDYADGGGRNDAAIPKNIEALGDRLGREILRGLEMKKIANGGRLKDQRRMIRTVNLGNRNLAVRFNEADTSLLTIEQRSIEEGEALKERFGGIADIPLEEIKRIGFERKLETPGYFLLYKIIPNGGAVIIRGDYKKR